MSQTVNFQASDTKMKAPFILDNYTAMHGSWRAGGSFVLFGFWGNRNGNSRMNGEDYHIITSEMPGKRER